MTFVQETRNVIGNTMGAHLLLTEGDMKIFVEDPEQVMEEIELRATQVSSILEGILSEPHGEPWWELNE